MVTPVKLIEGSTLTNAAALYYTSPAKLTSTVIKKLTITNIDGSAAHAVSIWLVPSAGATGAPSLLIDARQIAPGWPTVFMGEHPEAPDDQIPGVVALQHHWQNQQQQRVAQGLQPLPALRVKIVRRRSQMILE